MTKGHDTEPAASAVPYTVTITLDANPISLRDAREWLEEYEVLPVPRRNDHVLAKFIRATLSTNAEWDGVFIRIGRLTCRRADDAGDGDEAPSIAHATLAVIAHAMVLVLVLALAAVMVAKAVCHFGWLPCDGCHAVDGLGHPHALQG